MRCVGCEIDPLSPARYCECCGREISPNQNKSGEPHRAAAPPETVEADAGLYDWAPKRSAWDLRCPSCGGPSLDAGRCQCQKAAGSIEPVQPVAPASQVTPTPGVHPVEEIVPLVLTASTELLPSRKLQIRLGRRAGQRRHANARRAASRRKDGRFRGVREGTGGDDAGERETGPEDRSGT